jgi:hypothetical protein
VAGGFDDAGVFARDDAVVEDDVAFLRAANADDARAGSGVGSEGCGAAVASGESLAGQGKVALGPRVMRCSGETSTGVWAISGCPLT